MFHNISVKDALKLAYQQKARLYDLRTEEEYKRGHLPTAILIEETKIQRYLEIDVDVIKILYCNYGNHSLQLARDLSEEGYEVYSIVGGYHAYEGYVEKQKDNIWTMEWKNTFS